MSFASYILSKSPSWLQRRFGKSYLTTLGGELDNFGGPPVAGIPNQANQAVKARFPSSAPTDALDIIGDERGLPRAGGESDADYANDLRTAWDKWVLGGTALGLLLEIYRVGYQNRIYIVCQNGTAAYMDPVGTLVVVPNFPPSSWLIKQVDRGIADRQARPTDPWSWFQVFMDYHDGLPVSPPAPSTWTPTVLPAGNSPEIAALTALIKRWTPAHMNYGGIIVLKTGMCLEFDPNAANPFNRTIASYGGAHINTLGGTVTGYAP